ncbi:Bro-N domain-containing protein [Pseudomonas sp. Ap32]|nr:Bro-N domain-containing protein [Pseudomonas sp. Ap32]
MAGNAEQAGSSLKRRSPDEVRVVRASGNEINFGEEIVMGDNSTNVIPFNFREQQVRTLVIAGEPWFVAADVCRVLEVGNTTQAVQALDEDERSMFNIGRQGNANLVNESGLYTLILRSRDAVKKAASLTPSGNG